MPKPLILAVDDEPGIWSSIKEFLNDSYNVITVSTGEEAIEKFNQFYPNLVLIDIKLPGIDGIETLKRIKQIDNSIPVIIFSAVTTIENVVRAIKSGADDFLDKLDSMNNLRDIVNIMIRKTYQVEPIDIELLMLQIREKLIKNNTKLKDALDEFKSEYINFVSKKVISDREKIKKILKIDKNDLKKYMILNN